MPEVARILGISERGVRDKIERGQLDALKDGKRWMVLLSPEHPPTPPEDDAVVSGSLRGSGAVVDAIVTPAQIEQAIKRTGQKYVTDMAELYDRISIEAGRLYEGQLVAKDETIPTQREALTMKDHALDDLRRRAERAEAERDRLAAAQAAQDAPGAPEGASVTGRPQPVAGFWGGVRRVFGGGAG